MATTLSRVLAGIILSLLWVPLELGAQDTPERVPPAFSFRFDNDVLAGTDRCYTCGLTLGWQSGGIPDPGARPWVAWIPLEMGPETTASVSLTVGQKIYTPDDIRQSDLIEEDRPYAGVLFLTLGVPLRSSRHQRLAELTLGLVGPSSDAQSSQAFIHDVISGVDPQGWDNQLKDEPLLEVTYEHKWKALILGEPGGFGIEIIPHYGAGIGNLSVFAGVGGQARLGWNLPNDFGVDMVRPGGFRGSSPEGGREWGVQIYAAADRKGVLRNLLLDGNTFRDSHKVEKEPFTSDFLLGLGLSLWRLSFNYEYVYWTRKFKTESRDQAFSSFRLHFSY